MDELFRSGRIADCILVFMVLELLLLRLVAGRFGVKIDRRELIANLGAGAALVLGLRAALETDPWWHTAAWLLVALAFHALETGLRWSRGRAR